MKKITEILGIKYPIIQAPMSWITSAKLVAAVSNGGGLGVLGPNAGQTTVTNSSQETGERLSHEIRKTKKLTKKPFAVNYILPKEGTVNEFSEAYLTAILEEKVSIVVATGDSNVAELRRLKRLGLIVIFRESFPTIDGARAAENAGVDMIVATGSDEGGGAPNNQIGTFSIIPIIADHVGIPVIAAGGIVDRRTAKAAMVLGASGLFVGTKFITAIECPASEMSKQAIIQNESEDALSISLGNMLIRSTPTPFIQRIIDSPDQGTIGLSNFKLGMLDGDFEKGINSISSAISLTKNSQSAQAIILELNADL